MTGPITDRPRPRAAPTDLSLRDFEGGYALRRRIVQADGPEGVLDGRAVWSRDGNSLICRESGLLRLGGQAAMRAEREYRWGPGLEVFFADGRFFHRVPAQGGPERHWCDPDTYLVEYDFGDWPDFGTVWTVTGPRKDYTMRSLYVRL